MNARFFRYVQDAPWYADFLNPVLESLLDLPDDATILDLGTGAGKLVEMGQAEYPYRWVGADTDAAMLAEARQRASLRHTQLQHLRLGRSLPFADSSFDAVTFCSVLFLVPDPAGLMREAWRVLRQRGRVVVLTPSGAQEAGPELDSMIGTSVHNWTFHLWRRMTAGSGRAWTQDNPLGAFAQSEGATYDRSLVFGGLALRELLEKA